MSFLRQFSKDSGRGEGGGRLACSLKHMARYSSHSLPNDLSTVRGINVRLFKSVLIEMSFQKSITSQLGSNRQGESWLRLKTNPKLPINCIKKLSQKFFQSKC